VTVHSEKDCTYAVKNKKEEIQNSKIPTLFFTSSSGSLNSRNQSDSLKLKLNNSNNNSFGKPTSTSTENKDPTEYLKMDNYCVKKPESINSTMHTTTATTNS